MTKNPLFSQNTNILQFVKTSFSYYYGLLGIFLILTNFYAQFFYFIRLYNNM